MRICIYLLTLLFAAPAFAFGQTVFVVNTGSRAHQERVLRRAMAAAVTDPTAITVCGAGLSMLSNSDIEANVLLQRAKSTGVQIRKCRAASVADLALRREE